MAAQRLFFRTRGLHPFSERESPCSEEGPLKLKKNFFLVSRFIGSLRTILKYILAYYTTYSNPLRLESIPSSQYDKTHAEVLNQ